MTRSHHARLVRSAPEPPGPLASRARSGRGWDRRAPESAGGPRRAPAPVGVPHPRAPPPTSRTAAPTFPAPGPAPHAPPRRGPRRPHRPRPPGGRPRDGPVPPRDRGGLRPAARVARRALGGAFSLVSLVGADRQVVKGRAGSDLDETAVVDGVCRHTVAAGAPVVIPRRPRGRPRLRPRGRDRGRAPGLPRRPAPDARRRGGRVVHGGRRRGPGDWTPDDVQTLRDLAAAVVAEIAARAALRASGQARFRALFDGVSQLTGLLAHDRGRPRGQPDRPRLCRARPPAPSSGGRCGTCSRSRPTWKPATARRWGGPPPARPVRYEETVWDRSGRERVLDVRLTPAPGEPGLLLLEGRDVTEAARLRRVQSAMMVGQAGTWGARRRLGRGSPRTGAWSRCSASRARAPTTSRRTSGGSTPTTPTASAASSRRPSRAAPTTASSTAPSGAAATSGGSGRAASCSPTTAGRRPG